MSSIALDPCDYEMGDYDCRDGGYGCEDDGDYAGYDDSHDQKTDENEEYYSGGKYEEDGDHSSYSEDGDHSSYSEDGENDEPCDDSYDDDRVCERSYSYSESKASSYDGDKTYYTSHPKDEVVDHSLFKYNILFEDGDITLSEVPSGVNHESSVALDSYTFYSNPLWCEDFPPKDGTLYLEDERTPLGMDYDEKEGDIYFPITSSSWLVPTLDGMINDFDPNSSHTYKNTLDEVVLCATFLYCLFSYDDAHTFQCIISFEYKSANRAKRGVLDPSSWISLPFDPKMSWTEALV
uniref:Histidine-rich glycoprotein n=1 Tax=Solanum tuberosum TaxID=4113 RepID=M1DZ30_SOLTU